MAEHEPTPEELAAIAAANEESENAVNYKAPAQKSLQEIQELDKDDESLRKYKEALLGNAAVVVDPSAPNVQVTKMTLVCETAPGPLVLDLKDLDKLKKNQFVIKEGAEYRVKITFMVNKEIVSGLKYIQQSFRKGVKVDKTEYMVGSYGPRPKEEYEFLTPMEEAPKGLLVRGTYNIKSKFTDDDKHDHLSWEWSLTIKKDWKD
uniref:Rho GDP-dissociation inhibitor 1 n=1 Tax=Monopterus albus TaxID=43700 RepID=A0A3Q3KER3_MONAL|nr:rho GDP-dissociation inhibitor 1 [Monopterus albus]XP_020453579.1 rho GDP-dissociation inhibitor 1 [Monopterus albus]XP_020453580.1 rho GDP-dissociation inhibitor 1 [Monopterus albus]